MLNSTSVKFILVAVAALVLGGATPPGRTCDFAPALKARSLDKICAGEISEDVRVLASDEFQGRQPGTAGEDKAVGYLVKQLSRAGLTPAGDQGGWFQHVPIAMGRIVNGSEVAIRAGGIPRSLTRGRDITLLGRGAPGEAAYRDLPVVFAGYGLSRPALGWDDLAGVDLRGKVAIILSDPPRNAPDDNDFDAFLAPRLRYNELGRRGAAGVLIVNSEKSENWTVISKQGEWPQVQLASGEYTAPRLLGTIKRSALTDILGSVSMRLDDLEREAGSGKFRARLLEGLTLSARFTTVQKQFQSRTVAAHISGKRPPGGTIIYSAHWDHLGQGDPLQYPGRVLTAPPSADDIYNGAIDNAGGAAALLAIARRFAVSGPFDRSVLFLFFTAEEPGLLGSEYYVANPLVPLACTLAVFNVDTVPIGVPSQEVALAGNGKTDLELDIKRIAAAHRLEVRPTRTPNIYRRSDHLNFARAGVPALYNVAGSKPLPEFASVPGAGDEFDRYMQERYHHVTDEWRAELDFRPAAHHSQLLFELGSELARSRHWPQWNAAVPVRAMREESRRHARCDPGG